MVGVILASKRWGHVDLKFEDERTISGTTETGLDTPESPDKVRWCEVGGILKVCTTEGYLDLQVSMKIGLVHYPLGGWRAERIVMHEPIDDVFEITHGWGAMITKTGVRDGKFATFTYEEERIGKAAVTFGGHGVQCEWADIIAMVHAKLNG